MAKDKPARKSNGTPAKPKTSNNAEASKSGAILQDARFQHLVTDPRFRSLPKAQRKVTIDKRFQGMFTDDKFKVKYTVDKYGRRVNKSNAEDLKKYYELESGASSDSEEEKQEEEKAKSESDAEEDVEAEQRKEEQAISRETDEEKGASESDDSDDEDTPKTIKERLTDPTIDYARGEGRLVTDSSDGETSSDDEDNDPELQIDHVWGELHCDAETTEESSRRLAVCNMDWDRIRAADLMMLFCSFLPPGGSVLSVRIYPSEFGKERMAEEEAHGPQELVGLGKEVKSKKDKKAANEDSDSDDDDEDDDDDLVQEQDSDAEEGDDYHMEKLRQYQLNRLRYYYAVVECDSVATADKIYQECDGIEYESSATRVDLRFVPDDTSFDEDEPTDVCTERPDTNSYKPRQFTTTALQQAKVDLTWDETQVERRELGDRLSSGKLDGVSDKELRSIVAYSSEEEEDEDEENKEDEEQAKQSVKATTTTTEAAKEEDIKLEKGKTAPKEKLSKKSKKENVINKYKALLAEINENEQKEKNKKYEMELTWNVDQPKDKEADEEGDDSEADAPKFKPEITPIERVLQKRSEKNRKRKDERKRKKLQAQGIDPDEHDGGSDDDSEDDMPDGIDMNDPYFAEEFAGGDFIDRKKKKNENDRKQKQAAKAQAAEEAATQERELQLLLDDDDAEAEAGKQHFSLEQILKSEQETKSKKKRRKQLRKSKAAIAEERKEVEDSFQLNVNDTRFGAVYSSHLYNIDPTDSHFKKTKGMERIIHEKLKRRHGDGENGGTQVEPQQQTAAESQAAKRPRKQLENKLLVSSLKRKIQAKQQQQQ